MRAFGVYILFAAIPLAVLLYALLMSYFTRTFPPGVKWGLSPVLAAFLVGLVAALYEGGQLADACAGESVAFRLDIFIEMLVKSFLLALGVFTFWSLVLWRRGRKRLQV